MQTNAQIDVPLDAYDAGDADADVDRKWLLSFPGEAT